MRRFLSSLGSGLFFFSVLAAPVHATSDTPILFSKGVVAYSDGKYKEAAALFLEIYKKEPGNLDNLYFLGLTRQHQEKFSSAQKYFEELIRKNPEYYKVYFDYAWTLYSQGRFAQAFEFFEKSKALEPNNLKARFYQGIIDLQTGKSEEALGLFQELAKNTRDLEVARKANEWIAKIEKGEKPEAPAQEQKRWNLKASASFLYDSNVTLDPDGSEYLVAFNDNQADLMANAVLNFQYRFHDWEKGKIVAEYSGSQSAYLNDLNDGINFHRFNFGHHQAGLQLYCKLGEGLQFRLPVYYSFNTLGSEKYFQNFSGAAALDYAWNENWMTSLTGKFRRDDFFADPSNAVQSRDTWRPSVSLEQYFFFPGHKKTYLKGGYEVEKSFARGNDWNYISHNFSFAAGTPLFWKLQFLLSSNFVSSREFDYVDSVFGDVRNDFIVYLMGMLSREILPWLDVGTSYSFAYSDSNISRYTFKRNVIGITLSSKI